MSRARRRWPAWLTTTLLLAGSAAGFREARRQWAAYDRIATLELRPDSTEVSTPRLRSREECDYRLVVRGTFAGRATGETYDATEAFGPGGPPRKHEALEITPGGIDFLPQQGEPHRRVFVPQPDVDLAGQPITLRLEPYELTDALGLPSDTPNPFTGTLQVELWEHDHRRHEQGAAVAATLAGLLLLLGLVRLWRHAAMRLGRRVRRFRPARGSELARRMQRLRGLRLEALRALEAAPPTSAVLRRRVEALYHAAEDAASLAEAYSRARGPNMNDGGASAGDQRAREGHQRALARLDEIEATLALLPARLIETLANPPEEIDRHTHAIDRELQAAEDAGRTARLLTP
jgi:hypothetical protein